MHVDSQEWHQTEGRLTDALLQYPEILKKNYYIDELFVHDKIVDPSILSANSILVKAYQNYKTSWYSFLDDFTKNNITRLNIGEMITVHSAFKHPIEIIFPSPSYKWI